jgi:molybdopterin/thiamine biosynthesis adenylyltransferase
MPTTKPGPSLNVQSLIAASDSAMPRATTRAQREAQLKEYRELHGYLERVGADRGEIEALDRAYAAEAA